MFNIGGGELLVILLVALIVLGPNRLPGAARQVGQFVGELRRMSNGFQQELRDALEEPLDGFELDPGWNHRRRAPGARQAELRRPSARRPRAGRPGEETTAEEYLALEGEAPPAAAEQPRATAATGAAATAGAAGAAGAAEADPTASTGPVTIAPDAPDAPPIDHDTADPTASTGPVTSAPDAPDAPATTTPIDHDPAGPADPGDPTAGTGPVASAAPDALAAAPTPTAAATSQAEAGAEAQVDGPSQGRVDAVPDGLDALADERTGPVGSAVAAHADGPAGEDGHRATG